MLHYLKKPLIGVSVLAFAASSATALAADVTVSDAQIAGGKLVINGTTSAPNTRVRLDGQSGAGFNVTSGADKAFTFSLVYLPSDCVVTLQKLTVPSTLGAPAHAVVSDCGPRGLSPRGAWSGSAPYLANDLVTHQGSSWRAKRSNTNKQPVAGADWELFAAAGGTAADGSSASGGDGSAAAKVPPTGAAGGDLVGNYPNPRIRNLAVTNPKIANLAVTTVKIANLAVTAPKLANNAVTTAKLANLAVTNVKIVDLAVTTEKIDDDAVTGPKIADEAVTGAHVLNSSLSGDDLAPDSVGSSEISTGAVGTDEVLNEALTATDLATNSVGKAEIVANAVGSDELATVHEHNGPLTNIADGTAHDGLYTSSTSTVSCGADEDLLSVTVDFDNIAGHGEVMFSGITEIDRVANPETATVRAGFDGGAGPAQYRAVATCISP